jgi:hypothetical protein
MKQEELFYHFFPKTFSSISFKAQEVWLNTLRQWKYRIFCYSGSSLKSLFEWLSTLKKFVETTFLIIRLCRCRKPFFFLYLLFFFVGRAFQVRALNIKNSLLFLPETKTFCFILSFEFVLLFHINKLLEHLKYSVTSS